MPYSIRELARLSGVSRDRLYTWDRAGLLKAPRCRRGLVEDAAYTQEQALGVMALGELDRRGVSERRLRRAAALLPLSLDGRTYIVFDGSMVFARESAAEAAQLLVERACAGHVVEMGPLAKKLEGGRGHVG